MKTLLYTGFDYAYKSLADITVPRMATYAERRGMDFTAFTEPLLPIPNGIYWTGVCGALKAFKEGYDAAIYLDVDQLITNYDAVWSPMASGIHISMDWGNDATSDEHFSACGFLTYNDSNSYSFFKSVISMSGLRPTGEFPEQHEMREAYKKQKETGHNWVTVHPRHLFNAVPQEVSPGNVPEPWHPGDFAAHLTMLPLNERIELAKKILSKL